MVKINFKFQILPRNNLYVDLTVYNYGNLWIRFDWNFEFGLLIKGRELF